MKPSLQLKIGQQLTMTPQLQQAIRLLQLSSLDLHQEIQQSLYSNPLLELVEDADEPLAPESPALNEQSPTVSAAENPAEQPATLAATDEWDSNIPQDLPVDANWEDIYQPTTLPVSNNSSSGESRDFDSFHSVTESLKDHLLWQLNLTSLSAIDQYIGQQIIDAIDDNGTLVLPPEDIWVSINDDHEDIELDEVIAVLHRIQQFDPPGVGARTLQDCLSIQLNQYAPDTPFLNEAKLLVSDHLELVAARDYQQLQKVTGFDPAQQQQIIQLIQSLNPHPGDCIGPDDAEYIVPDVRVVKQNDRWQVTLNGDIAPKLGINQQYAQLIKRADSSEDNTFLRDHLQEAKWFLRSLESRNETLMRVSSCIVKMQQGFLECGPEAMKPMILADIASQLDLHESTISRVTTKKYIDTPQGVFELKYFFSSHVGTDDGGECSSTAIRAILKKMIKVEDLAKPLSDNKLALLLQEQGIQIARRTIAKYREGMGIAPSSERKRYKQPI